LQAGTVTLDTFRGVVFVGGFSYADVLDSAKGWAGTIKYDPRLSAQVPIIYVYICLYIYIFRVY